LLTVVLPDAHVKRSGRPKVKKLFRLDFDLLAARHTVDKPASGTKAKYTHSLLSRTRDASTSKRTFML
jgi:hypothetical protein